jgi:hypothetical protein
MTGKCGMPNKVHKPELYWQALVEVVERVIETRPSGAAEVVLDREAWTIRIQPRSSDAAPVEIGDAKDDEIYLVVADTLTWLWGDAQGVAGDVGRILQGVVDGAFTQAGKFFVEGRIDLPDGFIGLGEWTFVPWRWLPRQHRFAAYE